MKHLATLHSATSFLNSFLLEWDKKELIDGKVYSIQLGEKTLHLPLKQYSIIGRHHYTGEFILDGEKISFETLSSELVNFLSSELKTSPAQKETFLSRLNNSQKNIEQYLNKRLNDFSDLSTKELTFKEAEQGLFVGHTFHPTPKSRSEFSNLDLETYSPEMGNAFPLHWVFVKETSFYQKLAVNFERKGWLIELFNDEFGGEKSIPKGFTPFPMHPWQRPHILKRTTSDSIIDVGPSAKNWFPTSSLRTLFAPHADYMLKFSMSVRLTNSMRNLLVHELDRGLQVHDVFTHQVGEKFSKENPSFEVIHEPVYAGLLDQNGNIIQESLIVGRFNPFMKDSESLVVATLTQDHPEFKSNRLATYLNKVDAVKWFKAFLDVAVRPLIRAQANYGILLGAHQQNLIIEIQNALPIRSYFRDCNGTGYSELGHSLFSQDVKSLDRSNGNILPQDAASYLFGYYLVINTTFNIMSSLAHSGKVTEKNLLSVLRNELEALKEENLRDTSFIDYLLTSPSLMHKGNFLCSFRNINENTEENPLDIYTKIPNPIYQKVSMLPDLNELTYTPLSSGVSYKVVHQNGTTTVKSHQDEILVLKSHLHGDVLKLETKETNSKNEELLLVALEYLLGHNREIASFEAPGFNYLRSEFFQLRSLWHHEKAFSFKPERWTETNGRKHPVRLAPHNGTVYKRYIPEIQKTLSFRLANIDRDLDTFHEWHNQPRVAEFWELNQSKEELRAYLEKSLKDPHQFPMILEMDGEHMGYFEFYWVPENRLGPYYDSEEFDRGFHLLIGNRKALGYANTDAAIKSVLHCLYLDDPRTRKVMAEPRYDNQKIIRYAEMSKGWRKVKEFDFPHKRAALLENRRDGFFGGDAL